MFKPISMSKVNLFLLQKDLKEITNMLYDLKLIEFFDTNPQKFEKFESEDLNEQSSKLLRARSAISILKEYFSHETDDLVEKPVTKILALQKQCEEVKKEITNLKDQQKRFKIITALKITKTQIKDEKKVVGFISEKNARFLRRLQKRNKSFREYKHEKRIYFIANKKDIDFDYKQFYLPQEVDMKINTHIQDKNQKLLQIKRDMKKLANGNLRHIQKRELQLSKEIAMSDVKLKFAKTQNTSVLTGYIPSKDLKRLKKSLEETLIDKFELEVLKADVDEAPIKLDNSTSVSNFEALLKMYSLPKYSEFDPTSLMYLVFPIFFGFILGDVFYGLISLIFFTWLKKKQPALKEFMSVLQISSISSILFGFIFGEFMGFEPKTIFGFEHGTFFGFLARSHQADILLMYAIIFGVIHLNLGLIVGFVNNLKNIKKAIYDKLSWIILEFGIGFLYFGSTTGDLVLTYIGSALSLVAMVLMYLGHGFIGIIEIPGFFTNILSYARLMAVGLSSVVIAMLINQFSIVFFSKGIFGIIAGIILFTIGHIFNIVLGNFEGFLHSLRLHYVEFFTKFYTGGGKEFEPFGTSLKEE